MSLGLGVMIRMLGGNEHWFKKYQSCIGKRIAGMKLENNELTIGFEDGESLIIWDNGQSCCESRYMHSDDLKDAKVEGCEFLGCELKDAPTQNLDDYGGEHETQFLIVKTSNGDLTFENHNEHNGYYGGFSVEMK